MNCKIATVRVEGSLIPAWTTIADGAAAGFEAVDAAVGELLPQPAAKAPTSVTAAITPANLGC
ncbi:MAG: hypothetical protein M3N98_12885 [Actinomycetota bacterium]|nr:hypothetical protein [Actinomycetota bacterium]